MAGQEKWYFTKEQLINSPSRKCGLDADKELAYRQQAANLIQDMGQRLHVSQLCINTAIVYMHRFYAFHSFTQFHRNSIAAAALFLSAKVEEQPRKLEYVIKVAHVCIHRGEGVNNLPPEQYQEQAQELVFNENVLLQTLGFDVAIDHPHSHVVRACHLVKAPKDLAQTSYFMASNSLHLTTMCLLYKPTVVACFCIHLASKWSNWSIPQSNEGRHWFFYVEKSVTSELLEKLTAEFLHIFDKCPSRLKRKMMTMSNSGSSPHSSGHPSNVQSSPLDKKHPMPGSDDFDKAFDKEYERERRRPPVPSGYQPAPSAAPPTAPQPQKIDFNLYREKKEREERERRHQAMQQQNRPGQPQQRPPSSANQPIPHHQRSSSSSQHHHKPHHAWPHHKPPHHKPIHDHRHHRPPNAPGSSSTSTSSSSSTSTNPIPHPPQETVQRTRPPSLFSPENATTPAAAASANASTQRRPQSMPQRQDSQRPRQESSQKPIPHMPAVPNMMLQNHPMPEEAKRPMSPLRKRPDPNMAIREMQPPAILSPFSSPPTKEASRPSQRQRQHSNSEPELVPVVKKLDETPGYENVIRDSQRGNAIKARNSEKKQEPSRSLNGIETDPTLVSNLLKESLAKPVPITVATEKKSPMKMEIKHEPPSEVPISQPSVMNLPPILHPPQPLIQHPIHPIQKSEESEHKHKKEKKKKEKHKHKDRDKSKEEKKKHKKDKKRSEPSPNPQMREMQNQNDGGLRITIPKEKIATSPSLKIKIAKDRLTQSLPLPQSSGLKIKIPKDVLETSRKRSAVETAGPPPKTAKQNGAPLPKVGYNDWSIPPPHAAPIPYYMMQPPPMFFGGMQGYMFGMFPHQVPQPLPPQHMPRHMQPPLPSLPPPPVPPPPPE